MFSLSWVIWLMHVHVFMQYPCILQRCKSFLTQMVACPGLVTTLLDVTRFWFGGECLFKHVAQRCRRTWATHRPGVRHRHTPATKQKVAAFTQ